MKKIITLSMLTILLSTGLNAGGMVYISDDNPEILKVEIKTLRQELKRNNLNQEHQEFNFLNEIAELNYNIDNLEEENNKLRIQNPYFIDREVIKTVEIEKEVIPGWCYIAAVILLAL